MAIDLAELPDMLRDQCNVTSNADDRLLQRICMAAMAHTAADLGFALDSVTEFPDGIPQDVRQAILMLAAHWYENREATLVGVTAQSIPFGYDEIVRNHRSYTYG